jgi:hypothetical protein
MNECATVFHACQTEQLGKVLSSVAGAYKAAIAEVVADMGGSGVGAFDGLLLIMRHLKQVRYQLNLCTGKSFSPWPVV